MEKFFMVYLPLSGIFVAVLTGIIYESINALHETFQKNIIKLGQSGRVINVDEANYLLIKNDMIAESGKFIPFYNIKVLITLKMEYKKFLDFYIKKMQEKGTK